jgi:hypothetical protein
MARRFLVRTSDKQAADLERMAAVGKVPVAALLREATLDFGPVWVANRAADRVAGRPVKQLRAPNGSRRP